MRPSRPHVTVVATPWTHGAFLAMALGAFLGGWPNAAAAQRFTYRGFVEGGLVVYPRDAPNDDTNIVAHALGRLEPSLRLPLGIFLAASVEARAATHDQVTPVASYWDRTLRRPALAVRTLTATFAKGPLTVEIGKQFLRWGQSDIVSPADFFTARDYVVTILSEPLPTTAARLTFVKGEGTLEFVVAPRMTPSRTPLLHQRWIGLDAAVPGVRLEPGDRDFPTTPQVGLRYRRTGRLDYSVSVFHGPHHLPLLRVTPDPARGVALISQHYPDVAGAGGDAMAIAPGVTFRGEAAWFHSRSKDADSYGLWVGQLERQQGSWLLIGGYVGEWTGTSRGQRRFTPDRGLARGIIGRASWSRDDGRQLVVETLVRQTRTGGYLKIEYSRPYGPRWRLSVQAIAIAGRDGDFLGQYRLNSLTGTRARYSF